MTTPDYYQYLTEYDHEWKRNPHFGSGDAVKRMIAEMLALSMEELRQLLAVGIVMNTDMGRKCAPYVNPNSHVDGLLKNKSQGYKWAFEIEELLTYHKEQQYRKWIEFFDLKASPNKIAALTAAY